MTLIEFSKVLLNNVIAILIILVKLATPGLPQVTIILKKIAYDIITTVQFYKILSHNSSYTVHVVMWLEFVYYRVSITEVTITSIL